MDRAGVDYPRVAAVMGADGGREARTEARRFAPYAARYRAMAAAMAARLRAGTLTPSDAARYADRLDALNRAFDADCERWQREDAPPNPPPPALVDP